MVGIANTLHHSLLNMNIFPQSSIWYIFFVHIKIVKDLMSHCCNHILPNISSIFDIQNTLCLQIKLKWSEINIHGNSQGPDLPLAWVESAAVCPRVLSVLVHKLWPDGWPCCEKCASDIFVVLFSSPVLADTSLCSIPRNRRQGGGATGVIL